MNSDWAAQNLQTIRTLMERAAIYRRALAPMMFLCGMVGIIAAGLGYGLKLDVPRSFGIYWMGIAVLSMGASFLLVRRQALKDSEPFWSPPTKRVAHAMMPGLLLGLIAGVFMTVPKWREPLQMWWLLPLWTGFYGCALHSAGFFMPRGIRLFGWLFIIAAALMAVGINRMSYGAGAPPLYTAHLVMGAVFGGLHVAYGGYLYFTENRKATT